MPLTVLPLNEDAVAGVAGDDVAGPGAVPPMVLFVGPLMTITPKLAFGKAAVPAALVPM